MTFEELQKIKENLNKIDTSVRWEIPKDSYIELLNYHIRVLSQENEMLKLKLRQIKNIVKKSIPLGETNDIQNNT